MARRKKQAPLVADVGDVQEFASGIKSSWVECRSDGHDMRPFDVDMTEEGAFRRVRKCRRCGTMRYQVIDRYGCILNSKYKLPDGYQMPKGTGRLDSEGRGVFRLAAIEAEYTRKAHRNA